MENELELMRLIKEERELIKELKRKKREADLNLSKIKTLLKILEEMTQKGDEIL